MTDQELREALRLLLQLWEQEGQEACEALLQTVENTTAMERAWWQAGAEA